MTKFLKVLSKVSFRALTQTTSGLNVRQYTSGLEVLACSLDNNFNYMTTMLQLRPSVNH